MHRQRVAHDCPMIPKRIMIIAGETSGDILASELVRELRLGIAARTSYSRHVQPLEADLAPVFFGAGGPKMAEAGVEISCDMTAHSVVGLSDVIKNYAKFKRLLDELVSMAIERQPHAIICVDFSGFNRRFAAAVRKHTRRWPGPFNNWSPLIVQYISPQVWASRPNRVHQMQRDFDMVLSIFPFEKEWYARHAPRLRVEFVGHPLIDRYASQQPEAESASQQPNARQILLLPGSRRSELQLHLPVMLGAWKRINAKLPAASALVVLPNQVMADLAGELVKKAALNKAIQLRVGGLTEALKRADIALASTGTVTMECAYFKVPTITMYKTSWFTYQIGKRLIRVKSLTMPNLLAGEPVYPEFIQHLATEKNVADAALEIVSNPQRVVAMKQRLDGILSTLGEPGAAKRAAALILGALT